MYEHRSMGQGL